MPSKLNLIGKRNGSIVVTKQLFSTDQGIKWEAQCDCGNNIVVLSKTFNNRKSCLQCSIIRRGEGRRKDIAKQKFGRLIPIKQSGKGRGGSIMWRCLCDCGAIKNICSIDLTTGHTKSCGCLKEDVNKIGANYKHGMEKTQFYSKWKGMLNRCRNRQDKTFIRYGANGIHVCSRWDEFTNFRDDMYSSYIEHVKLHGEKNTTLDRIDNSLGYNRENCRWATWEVQRSNKTNRITVRYNGYTMFLTEFSKLVGESYFTNHARYKNGILHKFHDVAIVNKPL